jgi:hypothetical protein
MYLRYIHKEYHKYSVLYVADTLHVALFVQVHSVWRVLF